VSEVKRSGIIAILFQVSYSSFYMNSSCSPPIESDIEISYLYTVGKEVVDEVRPQVL